MRWTEEREQLLVENAAMGAETVRQAIYEVTGVWATRTAVIKHASRMGVSLAGRFACPGCGSTYLTATAKRYSDGLCSVCHHRALAEMYSVKGEYAPSSLAVIKAKRKYDSARKYHGIYGFSANLSEKKSTARSETRKVLRRSNAN